MTLDTLTTRSMILGGTSIAVIALAVVTTVDLNRGPRDLLGLDAGPSVSELRRGADVKREAAGTAAGGALTEMADELEGAAPKAVEPDAESLAGRATGEVRAPQSTLRDRSESMLRQESRAVAPLPQVMPVPAAPSEADAVVPAYRDQGRDRFAAIDDNAVKLTAEEPVSTFSVDVDTASYAFMRRSIMQGVLPAKDAVRVEEFINYFPYDYAAPESRETPFAAHVTVMPTPWNEATQLMRIGLKGYELAPAEKPRSNLVFLIDTSGSMNAPDKLPLLLNAFRLLVDQLGPEDTVSIVTYAGAAGTVLEPTKASEKAQILASLDRLSAGGSTAGGEGIRQAYRLAEASFDAAGVNRVILATDGDFNVGIRDTNELKGFIERRRETGVFLSVLGFGRGNYNDELMQALAQNGNGTAAYIDTLSEARKVLVDEASSTLFPIAKDVKVQIEFNPATVAEYRLIGYETRQLAREDFRNDKVDAGEIGSGHTVTVLYEMAPAGSAVRQIDDLRYAPAGAAADRGAPETAGEYAFLKIRYKEPEADESTLITRPVTRADVTDAPDADARFAAAVAAFGQLLRGGEHTGTFDFDDVLSLATGARGADPFGYRTEFANLARLAASASSLERLPAVNTPGAVRPR